MTPLESPAQAPLHSTGAIDDRRTSQRLPTFSLIIALAFVAAALLLYIVGDVLAPSDVTIIALRATSTSFFGIASLAVIGSLNGRGWGLAVFRLGPWTALWFIIAFGMGSLSWLGRQEGSALVLQPSDVASALTTCSIAITLWTVGYLLGLPRRLSGVVTRGINAVAGPQRSVLRSDWAGVWLYGLGIIGRGGQVLFLGKLGYVGDPTQAVVSSTWYAQILASLSLFALFGLATMSWQFFRHRTKMNTLGLLAILTLEVGYGLASGMKESMIMALIAILAAYGMAHARVWREGLVAAALIMIFVVVPFNEQYRALAREDGSYLTPTEGVNQLPTILSDVVRPDQLRRSASDSVQSLFYRVRLIDSVAIVQERTPSTIPYRPLSELAMAPALGLVPRVVWPSKPIQVAGYEFNRQYYGQSAETYSSGAVTPIADLYRYGGWAVLLMGMLLFGALLRAVDRIVRIESDPRMVYVMLATFTLIAKWENNVVNIISGLIVAFAGAAVAARIAFIDEGRLQN